MGSGIGDSWEVVFVNDGSKDRSLELLKGLAAAEPRYKVLSFARNFGHQMAITAGIDRAEGEAVVVMDADLQDPPEVVVEMVARWREGYDVVFAVRSKRHGETMFKKFTAAVFYRLLRAMLGGVSIPSDAGDFRLMSRPVVLTMRALREQHRFVRGMVAWVGFKQIAGQLRTRRRGSPGETKYPLRKMLGSPSTASRRFRSFPCASPPGWASHGRLLALVAGLWAVWVKLFNRGVVPGWTTIMILVAIGSSAQLLMTGILGEYVGRIYEEVKRRPLYVVREEIQPGRAGDRRGRRPRRRCCGQTPTRRSTGEGIARRHHGDEDRRGDRPDPRPRLRRVRPRGRRADADRRFGGVGRGPAVHRDVAAFSARNALPSRGRRLMLLALVARGGRRAGAGRRWCTCRGGPVGGLERLWASWRAGWPRWCWSGSCRGF